MGSPTWVTAILSAFFCCRGVPETQPTASRTGPLFSDRPRVNNGKSSQGSHACVRPSYLSPSSAHTPRHPDSPDICTGPVPSPCCPLLLFVAHRCPGGDDGNVCTACTVAVRCPSFVGWDCCSRNLLLGPLVHLPMGVFPGLRGLFAYSTTRRRDVL